MPQSPGDIGGNNLIVYPIDHMRETAAKILALAGEVQAEHDTLWQQIQNYISEDLDRGWQETVMECLMPYAARLRTVYDWQINLATALFDAVDAIEGTENITSRAFVPRRGPQM